MLFSHKETPTPCSVSKIAARTVIKNPSKIMDNFAKQCKFLKPWYIPHLIHNVRQDRHKNSQILREQHSKIFCQEESPRNSFGHYSVPICTTIIKNPSKRTCPRYVGNAMLKISNASLKPGSSFTSFNRSKFPEETNPPQSLPQNRGHNPPTKTPTLQLGLALVFGVQFCTNTKQNATKPRQNERANQDHHSQRTGRHPSHETMLHTYIRNVANADATST